MGGRILREHAGRAREAGCPGGDGDLRTVDACRALPPADGAGPGRSRPGGQRKRAARGQRKRAARPAGPGGKPCRAGLRGRL